MQPNIDFKQTDKLGSLFPPINQSRLDKTSEMKMMMNMMQQMQQMMSKYT